jgi:predicted nucleotidyltransferase
MTEQDLLLPFDQRLRIPEWAICRLVQSIAEHYAPEKIILFGSYAAGTEKPESDVDLLIVIKTSRREIDVALEMRHMLQPQFAIDLVVLTPERLKQRVEWGDWFLTEVLQKGVVLYESISS